jgi:hypothetical protein
MIDAGTISEVLGASAPVVVIAAGVRRMAVMVTTHFLSPMAITECSFIVSPDATFANKKAAPGSQSFSADRVSLNSSISATHQSKV